MTIKKRHVYLALLIVCLLILLISPMCLSALGKRDKIETVQITGVVRLVGSHPLSEIVISGTDREWHVPHEEEHKLMELQQQTVTVEGVETVTVLRFANGLHAGERYTLDNIRLIAIESGD